MPDSAPFKPVRLDHVVLRTAEPERLARFYQEVLGCALARINEKAGLWHLKAGDGLVDIVRHAEATPSTAPNMDHLCLRIAPWDEAAIRRHLSAHGIEAGDTARRFGAEGQGPSIYLTDPEGNGVELKGPPDA